MRQMIDIQITFVFLLLLISGAFLSSFTELKIEVVVKFLIFWFL